MTGACDEIRSPGIGEIAETVRENGSASGPAPM
jgi:hypothetical protein